MGTEPGVTNTPSWRETLVEDLDDLSGRELRRALRTLSGPQGPLMRMAEREVLMLAGNNYLGLASHPALAEAAVESSRTLGTSAAASPLISGHMEIHQALADALADYKGKESAVLFGSGFLANLGLITALAGGGDAVFSDEMNHASIIDGCRLSRAEVHIYAHGDMNALEDALRKSARARRRLIVTDGVFSMDGDMAPLPALAALAERHDAILLVDEAHATGIVGPEGRGVAAHFGVQDRIGVSMGTLGKALASYGAFACADNETTDFVVNKARSLIYSTALPPAVAAASREAVRLARGEDGERRRKALAALCARFRAGLRWMGFDLPDPPAGLEIPIFPLVVGEAGRALALADYMLEAGVFLLAIRPPTVPDGTSRLRATLMATHTEAQIDRALDALDSGMKKLGISAGDKSRPDVFN